MSGPIILQASVVVTILQVASSYVATFHALCITYHVLCIMNEVLYTMAFGYLFVM